MKDNFVYPTQDQGPQYLYLQKARKYLETLSSFLTFNLEKMSPRAEDKRYELSIKGSPLDLFKVRTFLKDNGMDFSVNRNREQLVEIRVATDDFSQFTFIPEPKKTVVESSLMVVKTTKVPKPKPEKIPRTKKVVVKKEKKQQPSIKTLAMCQNLKEEIKFLGKRLRESGFILRGEKINFRWESKDGGVLHYRCRNNFVEELVMTLNKIGYEPFYIFLGVKNEESTTVSLYLKNRPAPVVPYHRKNPLPLSHEKMAKKFSTKILINELLTRDPRMVRKFFSKLRKKQMDALP